MQTRALFGCDGRRCHIDQMTPAELIIYRATEMVEAIDGEDPRILEAVKLLREAREQLADYVDRMA